MDQGLSSRTKTVGSIETDRLEGHMQFNRPTNQSMGILMQQTQPSAPTHNIIQNSQSGESTTESKSIPFRLQQLTLHEQEAISDGEREAGCSQDSLHVLSEDDNEHSFSSGFPMRPKSKTFPVSFCKKILVLPVIKVEDFSKELNAVIPDQANTDEGALNVFSSAPRRRANTGPEGLFLRRRKERPPTPPPMMYRQGKSVGKKRLTFPRKTLVEITED